MASLCCEPRHSSASTRWQPAQVSLPTNVAAAAEPAAALAGAFLAPLVRNQNARPPETTIAAATDAATQVPGFDKRLEAARRGETSCAFAVCAASTDRAWDPLFVEALRRYRVNRHSPSNEMANLSMAITSRSCDAIGRLVAMARLLPFPRLKAALGTE